MAGFSRTRIQRLIQDGFVTVNGVRAGKTGLQLKKGDRVAVSEEKMLSQQKEFAIEPEPDIPLEIVYEDRDVLVLNKQPGLLVHPTQIQRRHTLVNALVARYPDIISVGENLLRPGIVHRLDKETSGLMAIAKNQNAFLFLKNQFLGRTIQKTYLAIVEGVPKEKEGVIRFQIRPSKSNRLKKVAVKKLDTSGKRSVRTAETRYKVKETIGDAFALVEAMPKTGRTHQIRVHLSAIGHPVVGDRLYHAKKKIAKRQMLHAYKLELTLPSGKHASFEAEMPEDMRSLIESLQKKAAE
jgi:23S rRNA pseudouridine1911/1915/1917 synthase